MSDISVNEMARRYFAAHGVQVDQETERMIVEAFAENKPKTTDKPKVPHEDRLKYASLEDIANFVENNK